MPDHPPTPAAEPPGTPDVPDEIDLASFEGHTEGPWEVRGNFYIHPIDPEAWSHAEVKSSNRVPPDRLDEHKANARLLAAGPTLLSRLARAESDLAAARTRIGELEAEVVRLVAENERLRGVPPAMIREVARAAESAWRGVGPGETCDVGRALDRLVVRLARDAGLGEGEPGGPSAT